MSNKILEGKFYINEESLEKAMKKIIIMSPNGDKLSLHIPNGSELRNAWETILEPYARKNASSLEGFFQDFNNMDKVVTQYHLRKQSGYIAFTVVDKVKKPVAIANTQIIPLSDIVEINSGYWKKGMAVIYQGVHNEEVSQGNTNFSVLTQMYDAVSKVLQEGSIYSSNDWLGVFTELASKGQEYDSIQKAGFEVIVPEDCYRPNLVLLARDMPAINDSESQAIAAEAYLKSAHHGQDTEPVLKSVNDYFTEQMRLRNQSANKISPDIMARIPTL
ncbi:MAG: hypothetical protein V1831_04640 [Candidatus Woesearchaeota archaeon]